MENFYLFIGTSGTGKSEQIKHLSKNGYECHSEAIREILEQKIDLDGKGFEPHETDLFLKKIYKRMKEDHSKNQNSNNPVFFDRGSPDLLAYAERFGANVNDYKVLAQSLSYNRKCFVFSPWREIFVNDPLRGMSFDYYASFHEKIIAAYEGLGFKLIEVPFTDLQTRTNFILENI